MTVSKSAHFWIVADQSVDLDKFHVTLPDIASELSDPLREYLVFSIKNIIRHVIHNNGEQYVKIVFKIDTSEADKYEFYVTPYSENPIASDRPGQYFDQDEKTVNSARIEDAKGSRQRLFSIAEFLLPRHQVEDWRANAEDYYNSYAERTSELRANVKLAWEVAELAVSRLWKPLAAAIGIPKLMEIISKLS